MTPRELALSALNSPQPRPGYAERHLERAFRKETGWGERDRAFALHLVQGTLRWRRRLDWIIQRHVRFAFSKIENPVLNLLRIALYQIFFMDRVPDSAAVDEAVTLARSLGGDHVTGFVNGLLRNVCRHKGEVAFPDGAKHPVAYLSVFHAYPEWLVEKWIHEVGVGQVESLLEAGNRIPTLVVRTNTLKIDREGLIRRLEAEGVEGIATDFAPEGIAIRSIEGPVTRLKAFEAGLFQVQGEAAQICAHLLRPQPGERVLDLCAGLGGKTTHLAALMGNRGSIISLDMSRDRLLRLLESARRLGTGTVRAVVGDASGDLEGLFSSAFDRILLDAPCSGLGVLSRHPDGKWLRDAGDVMRLAGLQRKMLDAAVGALREGGRLLYVTCTLSREENEGGVVGFLAGHKEMGLLNLGDEIPVWGRDLIDPQGFFRSYPHVHNMDGFFGAAFVKEGGAGAGAGMS